MEIVTASGSHYEVGRQVGIALRDSIRWCMEKTLRPDLRKREDVKWVRSRLEENMMAVCPELLEEMRGIAAGAGLPYKDILTYNCIGDISHIGNESKSECSNIAFVDTERGPAIGKTNDIGENAERYHALHRLEFNNGRRLLNVTWPGTIWANAAVNDQGLAYGGTSVVSKDSNPEGIISNALLRLVVQRCASVPEAVEMLKKIPVMYQSANLTFADAQGNLVVVEKSPTRTVVRRPRKGAIFATNHWITAKMKEILNGDKQLLENSRARFKNFTRLVKERKLHSVERIKEILRDHSSPGAICQHGPYMHTSVAYVILPHERALLFSYGKPCKNEFEEFRLIIR